MQCFLALVLALCSAVHSQKSTLIPPIFTSQPTDLLTGLQNGLVVRPLMTQAFLVETQLNYPSSPFMILPCAATANPEAVTYSWLKLNPLTKSWSPLSSNSKTLWSTLLNGDPNNAGQLSILTYDKVTDAGSYLCAASTKNGSIVSYSKVVYLIAANFVGEGTQAKLTTRTFSSGSYVKLDVPVLAIAPLSASWVRTGSSAVPSGGGSEIPPDRSQVDENGALHIGYMDNSLLQGYTSDGSTIAYSYFHYKYLSMRYIVTDVVATQLVLSGTYSPTGCQLQYQTQLLNLVHGQSSRIACVFSGAPTIKVSYSKQSRSTGIFTPLTTMIANRDIETAMQQTGLYGNTYYIGSAQATDAGTYTCSGTMARPGDCPTASQIVVSVDMEPSFVLQPSPIVYVVEGTTITLEWRIKGEPKPTIDVGQNGQTPLVVDPSKITSTEPQKLLYDPVDNMTLYVRTVTLRNAVKPVDTRSLQVYATNKYYQAISNVALTVISPITFAAKMSDQLSLQPGSKASFTCMAFGDDALPLTTTWTRFFGGVTYPVVDTGVDSVYTIMTNEGSPTNGLSVQSQTLLLNTPTSNLDSARGQYACNVSNSVTWNVTSARLSFFGDEPVAAASFEMWMLGPILGGVAAIILVIGIIVLVRHNRGEKYEVEGEEIKKGYDPKKEAHEQRELREYQRDREKDSEPLRQSQHTTEIEQEEEGEA